MDIQKMKPAIKQLVLDLRHTLEDELAIALKRYGIFADQPWSLDEPPARLTGEAEREIWGRIVAVVRRGIKEGRTLPEASRDYVRESAFTFLNRLVGLKCLEVRGLIDEVITSRDIYGGRSKFHRDYRDEHPRQARAADDALPAALAEACRRVNEALIGYLFDPDDDHSLVWPRYAVLKSCIEKINGLAAWVWAEDEIIGWIYQFYNAEEKVAVRRRGKPQTPHQVAVINQFFTPRWVVKFLVDNTLGRLWLEMYPDSPRVREKCDYLVPELLPSPLAPLPPAGEGGEGYTLDPDSPINNPQAAPRRAPKPITQLRLLDPACGTMHFGHYACEVFEAMYRDARDRGDVQIEDWRIPGAILEYNLFGVDIDRRAVQLAALSLFMKARTMHPQAQVAQVNLVVADATLPDSGVKERFLARYAHDRRVQRAFAQVLEEMDQVAQVGSLLRVEERLRELLARAGHAAAAGELEARRQRELPGLEPEVRQLGLAELLTGEQAIALTPHYTLQELRDDLRTFARQALQEHDVNAQLFATEADKAMRLLDVLMGKYDVVVMNPPYGSTTEQAKSYLQKLYPDTWNDLYAAFLECTIDLLHPSGLCGALTSRTFMFLSRLAKVRKRVLMSKTDFRVLIDLGHEVLDDAMVETAAYTFETRRQSQAFKVGVYFRLIDIDADKRENLFTQSNRALKQSSYAPRRCFTTNQLNFTDLPTQTFAYWASQSVTSLYKKVDKLGEVAEVRPGLTTLNNERFVRHHWEVAPHTIGRDFKWVRFAKGGDYSSYYYDNDLVLLWENNGAEMREFIRSKGETESRFIANQSFYFQKGLTYPRVTNKGFNVRHLPSDHIFAEKGISIFPISDSLNMWILLGYLNSSFVQYLLLLQTASRSWEKGIVSALPYDTRLGLQSSMLARLAIDAHDLKATWDTGNEICTRFATPWLLQLADPKGDAFAAGLGEVLKLLGRRGLAYPITLNDLLAQVEQIEGAADARLQQLQAEIDEAVYALYEISPADRALIEQELGDRPPELVWPQMEGKSKKEKRREHVRRFFSYFARQAAREDEDGIVPLAGRAARGGYLIDRVRALLEAQFGPEVAYQLEQDAAPYLGRPLEDWLGRFFFHQFHARLYKNRPILWHMTSPKGYFAVLLDYHRLTRDTLPKIKMLYLQPQLAEVSARLSAARADEAPTKTIAALEDELADLEAVNKPLSQVIDSGYDPDIDAGVKANLLPIQAAGLLPVKKVV